MKARALVVLEAVFLGLGLLVLSPSANPTAVSEVSVPSQTPAVQASNSRAQFRSGSQQKPLAVWE
jgi:hypothetical protein